VAVVVATTPNGAGLFAVDLESNGRPGRESSMDRTRAIGWLDLDKTPATKLGGEREVEALVDRGATFAAAEMLGGAGRALDMAVEYAKDRVQFGRAIGSFQAVKHRCADMLVDVEGMRSTSYWAAWCIGAGDPEASVAASTAKIWCADASKRVMASALQVHGGIGFTWEHDLHVFMKRAQLDQLTFGDASFHRERLARLLRTRVEAGDSVI
jgi:alkylation response protein AidB-like acyl-CoA dehydrogenase